ncbi:hypothetical protein ACQP1G_20880 [Nocardia sp. CA-107356]|uniref:hypothetical protein n=1 Tax=Nocardia sp. CA-107356 TaxID=3239972 RepID=UPI003D8F2228
MYRARHHTTTDTEPEDRGCRCGLADCTALRHNGDLDTEHRYFVVVERPERIRFELHAHSRGDAEERYLLDGETTGTKSAGSTAIEIGLA